MEKFERKLLEFLEKSEVENGNLKEKVMEKISKRRKVERFRKAFFSALIVAVVVTFGLSFVAPVFGKAGTLPQLIKSVKIESAAKSFEGVIEIDETILQKITDANLTFADTVVVSALFKDKSIDIDKVIEMRKEGFGWGKILDTLNATLNEKDVQRTDTTNEQLSNKNKNSDNQDVPAWGKTEQNKNENKNANREETKQLQNTEQEKEQEQNDNELIIIIKGTVSAIIGNTITISEEVVTVNETTTIRYLGKSIEISQIKVGDPILVHATRDGDTLVARDMILFKNTQGKQNQASQGNKNEEMNEEQKKSETSQNEEQNRKQNSQKEFELNTVILSIQEDSITLKDFANTVILDDSTKIEQVGAGRVDKTALKEGQTVQIHIRFDGTSYKATQIVIQEKAQSKENSLNSEQNDSNKQKNNSSQGKKP